MSALFQALALPFMVLNMLGGIVSGIWLAFLRDWASIGYGVASLFVSAIGLSLVLMPGMIFTAPTAYFAAKGRLFLALIFGSISNLYTAAVITVWCCGVLFAFLRGSAESNFLPRLLWSYGIALSPWSYMASKEGESWGASLLTFTAQIAYVAVAFMIFFASVTGVEVVMVFAGIMALGLIVQMFLSLMMLKEGKMEYERSFGRE